MSGFEALRWFPKEPPIVLEEDEEVEDLREGLE